jgi:indolepyruvate ferredoxin oxidoreductase
MKLSDKYTREDGRVYLTGIQALVRLPVDQMRRDRRAGLNSGTFISGYEGSPLGGYDMALTRQAKLLAEHNIHFVPGVNEDLAATSVMGSQIIHVMGKTNVDGVVGIWYGKGPGVDRSGDIFRHANLAGTGKNCGALVLCGDDHISKSSTIPHQSDFSLLNFGIPFLYPGNTQEVIDYGLYAIALSRFSGAWTGLKMITDVCDGGGTVEVNPELPLIRIPDGYEKHTDARIVAPITLGLEHETNVRRIEAALRFARLNGLNRFRGNGTFGILTAGKSYYDLMQSLRDLDVLPDTIRIGKVAMPFPLDPEFAREFAAGLQTILVVEEKRSFLEFQLKDALYTSDRRPVVHGKDMFPPTGELDPDRIAVVVGRLLSKSPRNVVPEKQDRSPVPRETQQRPAAFCSGCPHNRSTLLLEGQVAGGGIGCHTMALRLADSNRSFAFMTQMGGEGAPWIGMTPFVDRTHVFQNLGDGTLFHSGYLAIEACIAANVNITYKILYNGHVAMTGGQKPSGALPVPALTKKLQAEGVRKIVVLAEDVGKYRNHLGDLASNAELRSRDDLPVVLAELEKIPGVTVMIYDQQCAAEKRRMRSRGLLKEPTKRLVIHEEVCEGCGDCVKQANCMSLTPVATELGQKMRIHQSSCNKDYTCALGDCPSFVTVNVKAGTGLKKRKLPSLPDADVPEPRSIVKAGDGYRIIAPGIGGTGVVTISALLATAAWIDGLHVATLDMTGTAQKGGAVVSHLLLSEQPVETPAKVNTGNADLILGFDMIGVASKDNLKTANRDRTIAVVNTDVVPTIDVIRNRLPLLGSGNMIEALNAVTDRGRNIFVDANRLAEALFGSHMAVNIFLTGVAWQGGLIPISLEAIHAAVELNGVEKERNLRAFNWGRKYYTDAAFVERYALSAVEQVSRPVLVREEELVHYQNKSYAQTYLDFLAKIPNPTLRDIAARYLYKLMAYKDEYEVARLLTKRSSEDSIRAMWESPESIRYNLHPPLLRRFGMNRKLNLGPWFRYPLRLLSRMKFLRGTPFDPFGYASHRRKERELMAWYRALIEDVLARLTPDNLDIALEIASLPGQIRGYEKIKEASIDKVKKAAEEKLQLMQSAVAQLS